MISFADAKRIIAAAERKAAMTQAIPGDLFPPEKRGVAFALYGVTAIMAPPLVHSGRRRLWLPVIANLIIVSAVSLVALVIWEWRHNAHYRSASVQDL